MLFNSFSFVIFAVVVFALYLSLRHRGQNVLLLFASIFFYGWWDWRFLSLLFISIVLDFYCGARIAESRSPFRKRFFLILSICGDLGILVTFKYFNFFVDSFVSLISFFGFEGHLETLNIILPLGISFYTFQTMSYTIDIYRGHAAPTRSILDFAVYVMFFPQLVAGPIERATNLLPRIETPRTVTWNKIREGCSLLLSGYFKKMVIADNMAPIVDEIFYWTPVDQLSGANILIGVYAFAWQIYGDFSGYSDIARGLGKILGIELMLNFRRPYFAVDPSDFWRRWHISLSTWLRDYLYIPLGGNRYGKFSTYRNLAITMLLGGLWHGAATHFILWGGYHGLLLAVHRRWRDSKGKGVLEGFFSETGWSLVRMVVMFHLTCLGWFLFRVETYDRLMAMLKTLITDFRPETLSIDFYAPLLYFTPVLFLYEIVLERNSRFSDAEDPAPWWLKCLMNGYMMAMILFHGVIEGAQFIYFQF